MARQESSSRVSASSKADFCGFAQKVQSKYLIYLKKMILCKGLAIFINDGALCMLCVHIQYESQGYIALMFY